MNCKEHVQKPGSKNRNNLIFFFAELLISKGKLLLVYVCNKKFTNVTHKLITEKHIILSMSTFYHSIHWIISRHETNDYHLIAMDKILNFSLSF